MNILRYLTVFVVFLSCNSILSQYYESKIDIVVDGGFLLDVNPGGHTIDFLGYSFYQDESCIPPGNVGVTLNEYNVCATNLVFNNWSGTASYSESIITSFNPFEDNINGRLDARTSIALKPGLQNAGSNLYSVNYNTQIQNFEECSSYFANDSNTGQGSSILVRVAELGKNLWNLNPQYHDNNEIGCGDFIDLKVNACGIDSHYALEYQIWDADNLISDWQELIPFGYHDAPNLGIEDLPGVQPGYSVWIKLRYVEAQSNINDDYSDKLVFEFISCSPQLIPPIMTEETSCSYFNDGGFAMNLDRDLEDEEQLVVSLYAENQNNPGVFDMLIGNNDTLVLQNNGDDTYGYQWPDPISAGTYKIKYQTHPENAQDAPWDSLEFSQPFTIESADPVTFSLNATNVNCHGGSDGSITVTANGGTGNNYQYRKNGGDWTDLPNDNTIKGLSEGQYTIEVQDGNQCEGEPNGTGEITVGQPGEPLSISLIGFQEPTAFGFTNGSVTAIVEGGTPLVDNSYGFQWTDEQNNVINNVTTEIVNTSYHISLNNIGAGTYTLTVWDDKYNVAITKGGCTAVMDFVVSEPPALQLSIQKTNPISCNSQNSFNNPTGDGELTAIASGGVPFDPLIDGFYPYIYTWKKKDTQNNWQTIPNVSGNVLSNLGAGEYSVNIRDMNDITIGTYQNNTLQQADDVVHVLEEPELLVVDLDKSDVNCFGGSDGSVTVSISGGTPPYDIFWSTGESTETIEGLMTGNYAVYVMDSKGCEAEGEIFVGQPNDPVSLGSQVIQNTTAFGFTDGSITVYVNGGTPYPDGSYSYEWKDEEANIVNTTTAQITPEGYQILLEEIPAGIYTLSVQDANYNTAIQKEGCTYMTSYEVTQPEPLLLSIESLPISCNSQNDFNNPSEDGELIAIASGGVPFDPLINEQYAYIYTWKKKDAQNNWQAIPDINGNVLSNLGAGEYAVNIEDANGIIVGTYVNNILQQADDVVHVLEEPELLVVDLDKTDVNCFGGSDGSVTVSISGGTPPYDIFWSTGESTETIEGLMMGNYSVYVMDSKGCEAEGEIFVGQPNDPVSLGSQVIQNTTAFGFTDGSITVYVNGGTPYPDGSYTYEWKDEEVNIVNTTIAQITPEGYQILLEEIPAGTYTLSVQDANYNTAVQKEGCTYMASYEVTQPEPLKLSIGPVPISCSSANNFNNPSDDGQLIAIASGGTSFDPLIDGQHAYIYTWKKKDAQNNWQIIPNVQGNVLADVDANEYAVNIEDANGIVIGTYVDNLLEEVNDVVYLVEEPEPLAVNLIKEDVSCFGGNDGSAEVLVNGGIPPYQVWWSTGAETAIIEDLKSGTYLVYAMDAYGCEVSGQVTVGGPEALEINIVQFANPTCHNARDGTVKVEINGGTAPYSYSWHSGETNTSLSGLAEGTYIFQVIDANGCTKTTEIEMVSPEPIVLDLEEHKTLCLGQVFEIDITIDHLNATYEWVSDNGFYSTSSEVILSEQGTYTATVTTALGCFQSDTIEIVTSDAQIDSEFLITSQAFAGEEIALVNTSNPFGTAEEWIFPEAATVVEESTGLIVLRFEEPGAYEVTLRNYQGDCYADFTKNIVVDQARQLPDVGDAADPFIKEYVVFPNPSSGTFTVRVSLREEAAISLRLYSLNSNVPYDDRQLQDSMDYEIPYQLNLPSGVYLLLLETPKENQIRKIVVL